MAPRLIRCVVFCTSLSSTGCTEGAGFTPSLARRFGRHVTVTSSYAWFVLQYEDVVREQGGLDGYRFHLPPLPSPFPISQKDSIETEM